MYPPEGQQYVSVPHKAVLSWPEHTSFMHALVSAAPDTRKAAHSSVSRGRGMRMLLLLLQCCWVRTLTGTHGDIQRHDGTEEEGANNVHDGDRTHLLYLTSEEQRTAQQQAM